MNNSSAEALKKAQTAFWGEAERLGLKNDDDVVNMIKAGRTVMKTQTVADTEDADIPAAENNESADV